MDRFGWLPTRYVTMRGWGLLAAGVVALLLAQIFGRRDLLSLAVFLIALPLLAAAVMVVLKPRFAVERKFRPASVETGLITHVQLSVRRTGSFGGIAYMEEQLPHRFGRSPTFRFPARYPTRTGESIYEYRLRSGKRGMFGIGPVTADFEDPFGLARHRHNLGEVSALIVTPAPVELPPTSLTGARGTDGTASTRRQANPSDDDVMTREYRHGDPMRRVHWAATARQGELMVRQEESVTTPQATIILDQRVHTFGSGLLPTLSAEHDGGELLHSSPAFEWAVTAVASAAHDFIQRNYTVRLLDVHAEPGLLRSPSAPWPEDENFVGPAGYQNLAEGLAALGLAEDPHRRADRPQPGAETFGDRLMDKLAAHKLKGPLLALLGNISAAEARLLAPAAEFGSHAFAILVMDHPHDSSPVLEALRNGGWRAVAVNAKASLPAAWSYFDAQAPVTASTARSGPAAAGPVPSPTSSRGGRR
ncbi:DUF58 domain-containing protein [Arthrobacter crystallopoietes]|uniref:Uncharacterized conserved protein, DUF58 family, contains vWF domain n=1 Tax=Crystallibacter crystallopoietes TaxID=37928 RepID=A0A1H0ZYP9_9MICC|nr:DUF58 domain-containing protein [Arthrobacter crystallopoietes]AUI51759.1 hypothetical protein AC20117_14100 [Arthrobacter crystallopoietes]SDQ32510.1 Uncharacterized conserved protein, DUF58 family, contains vWF domain [Arthrobacter crystallopoietes]